VDDLAWHAGSSTCCCVYLPRYRVSRLGGNETLLVKLLRLWSPCKAGFSQHFSLLILHAC
jgi:hypothetical protein